MSAVAERFAKPTEIDAMTAAFPANVRDLMPARDEIPDEFKEWQSTGPAKKWLQFQQDWFFHGLPQDTKFYPNPGVDRDAAIRHLRAVQSSFEPKHEHKQAAVAYLASLWFDDISYSRRGMK